MPLNKVQAAFFDCDKYKKKRSPCLKCGGLEDKASSSDLVKIDYELLKIWVRDEGAFFMSQDEELLIAEAHSSILFQFLNYPKILESKRLRLLEALMVRLTDKLTSDLEEAGEIARFLHSNRNAWDGVGEIWIYLQKRTRKALKAHKLAQ